MKACPESSDDGVEPLNHGHKANDPLLQPGTRSFHCRHQTMQMCLCVEEVLKSKYLMFDDVDSERTQPNLS